MVTTQPDTNRPILCFSRHGWGRLPSYSCAARFQSNVGPVLLTHNRTDGVPSTRTSFLVGRWRGRTEARWWRTRCSTPCWTRKASWRRLQVMGVTNWEWRACGGTNGGNHLRRSLSRMSLLINYDGGNSHAPTTTRGVV